MLLKNKNIIFKIRKSSYRLCSFKHVKIPSYPSIYENVYKLQKIFLVSVFWLKYIFRIKFKIPILDLILLPKNSVPFEVLYSSSWLSILIHGVMSYCKSWSTILEAATCA